MAAQLKPLPSPEEVIDLLYSFDAKIGAATPIDPFKLLDFNKYVHWDDWEKVVGLFKKPDCIDGFCDAIQKADTTYRGYVRSYDDAVEIGREAGLSESFLQLAILAEIRYDVLESANYLLEKPEKKEALTDALKLFGNNWPGFELSSPSGKGWDELQGEEVLAELYKLAGYFDEIENIHYGSCREELIEDSDEETYIWNTARGSPSRFGREFESFCHIDG